MINSVLHEVKPPHEEAMVEMVRLIVRQKPVKRDVNHWERGWLENLKAYKATGNLDGLKPKYIRSKLPLRLNGRFVIPEDPEYEWKWYREFLKNISDSYLADATTIYEFGCGSGHNVAWLASRFPDKLIVGCDWSKAAVFIIGEMRRRGLTNVEGRMFDFYNPADKWATRGATMLTVGAMEQTGMNWQPMLDWFVQRRPLRVVHIEPQYDLYDPKNLVDQTAMEAHEMRGFWRGYAQALIDLEKQGKVVIEEYCRTGFGSLLCEGYSQLVWRPT